MKLSSLHAAAILVLTAATANAADPPTARVELLDGRTLAGYVDDATDAELLWIRQGDDRVVLATSYRWEEVAGMEIDGQPIDAAELLDKPSAYMAAWPRFGPEFGNIDPAPVPDVDPADCELQDHGSRRAASSSFVATLANWDGDVEPDGYVVSVTVLDTYGHPMAVGGSLSARLVGERLDVRGTPVQSIELERWSESVQPEQFAGGAAVVRLPFRLIRPEVDLHVAPNAILQIEIGAFGHGRYASSSAVAVRAFNPIRDRYQQRTGSRFVPAERHERWSHD